MSTRRGRSRHSKPSNPLSSSALRILTSVWFITIVALILRLGFAWEYSSRYSRRALGVLPFLFESGNIAVSLATGHGFSSPFRVPTGPTAWMTPVYPLLLAAVLRVFGTYTLASFVVAVGLNIVFVAAACIPIYFATKRMAGSNVAAAATWLWAIFPNAILIPVESLWEASLSALLVATIVWATLRLCESPSPVGWSLYGLLWGFTLMTNPSIAAVLPFLLGWLAWRTRAQSSSLRWGVVSFAIMAFCCVPWTIRNYRVFHTFVPLRSIAGLPLWLGNNPQAQPRWSGQLHPIVDSGERALYVRLGEISYMREKLDLALAYMVDHPGRELQLIGRRFIALWCGGTPFPIDDFLEASSFQFRYVLLFNIVVALGTLAGIVLLIRVKNRYWLPLAIFPLVFPITYYLTMVVPRYRLPIDPVLMMLTALALSHFKSGRHGEAAREVAHVRD